MRFTEEVVLFDFAGIPMVGCLDTGYAIGLTEQGAAVCWGMSSTSSTGSDAESCDVVCRAGAAWAPPRRAGRAGTPWLMSFVTECSVRIVGY